jgi:hypothetical protein
VRISFDDVRWPGILGSLRQCPRGLAPIRARIARNSLLPVFIIVSRRGFWCTKTIDIFPEIWTR